MLKMTTGEACHDYYYYSHYRGTSLTLGHCQVGMVSLPMCNRKNLNCTPYILTFPNQGWKEIHRI